ncbi:3-isopropylmalate dehydratase large subunit [Fusibacter paucivorans]|uniref:3-isopropylmalate dehydratase large subunit n=1 Tax=Fusibacter paucivorans TaxID=76009 RepID=A0ABS5PN82_9FIRM|nr:3-isopropylmalate dehydratase large subunit [Fusibacter paucivorans]MBS7526362.1 3-isopropylmalate dehydratase large subunit [Fusibacter paucivorans]
MHAIEKILAKASGRTFVKAGEIISAKVDFAEINDLYLQTIKSFDEMGGEMVWDRNRLTFVFDHYAPAPTIKSAAIHQEMRDFAKVNHLTHHFDINEGVCHQVMPEHGVICPGTIVVATDSHTTTHGAFGAFGTGIGATDMATVMMTGELWFRVPEIIEIRIEGTPPKNVLPKDVVLSILGKLKADGAVYKAIEFSGSYIKQLDVPGRMVICNMAVEMGAKTAYMQPNDAVLKYVGERAQFPFEVHYSDEDFAFSETHHFDITHLSPQIAMPHSVDNVVAIEAVPQIKVNQGFIGTCTGGRVEDIAIAAKILKGHKLDRYVRLVVIPASKEVLQTCMKLGYIQDLIDAGATISTPGCGPCLGAHEGILAPGEVCITASNRNFPGRMGSVAAEIYLASPATVAASVKNGYISDPRQV